jgi:hypothetical protein
MGSLWHLVHDLIFEIKINKHHSI